jgi:hypothetical protein
MSRSFLSDIIGRLGLTVNPQTGQRVRTRSEPRDDWGNTRLIVEEQTPSGSWVKTGDVPGSSSGGHY